MRALLGSTRLRGLVLLFTCASLAGCGSLLQGYEVGNANLTALVKVNRFPIYWAGGNFEELALKSVHHESGGAYSLRYGDCSIGGAAVCVTPLEIVTTPEGDVSPTTELGSTTISERGLSARVSEGGRAIQIATGPVVVNIYAQTAALAQAAAATMTPINRLGTPDTPLPAPGTQRQGPAEPLPGQLPSGLSVVHGKLHQSGPHTTTGPTGPRQR